MTEDAKKAGVLFKLVIFSIAGMAAVPFVTFLSPFKENWMAMWSFSLWIFGYFVAFALFLRLAKLLLCSLKALLLIFLTDYLVLLAVYQFIGADRDNVMILLALVPSIISSSYYCFSENRKLIQ